MSRDSDYTSLNFSFAAATQGTVSKYRSISVPFLFEGWDFMYETTEANADNTVTVAIAFTIDGSNFTTLKAVNSNTAGLGDSGAALLPFRNPSNPASAGVAWGAESSPTDVRVPVTSATYATAIAPATVRVTLITAGTGTIPAIQVNVYGKFLAATI